ncbi:MAG TPA: hypothetical protein VGK73_39100 [Polyangiaceae bacterium]
MRALLLGLFAFVLFATFSNEASAQVYTRRSYVLPQGRVELTGTPARPMMMGLNVSENSDFEPFHFPLHVYFGVTEDLTLGITHDLGLCPNCDDPYNDVGLGLLYGIVRDPSFELDLHLTAPLISSFDPFFLSVRGGVLGRVNFSNLVAMVFDPSLKIGLTNRAAADGNNKEYLYLPVWVYFQATQALVPFVGTAFHGPLQDYFDDIQVPLEGGMVISVNQNVDLGFVLTFLNLLGSGGDPEFIELGFVGRFRF